MTGARTDRSTESQHPLHVLREYALIADGERGALIGPRGDVVWMCAPTWDSGAVFASLIGGGGTYSITPADARFVWGGYYEEGTLIWHSRWITETSTIECREALAFPGDRHRVVLLRRVVAVHGDAQVRVRLAPAAEFGAHRIDETHDVDGAWTARAGTLRFRWTGAVGARNRNGDALEIDLTVAEGHHHDFVLEISEHELPPPPDIDSTWQRTERSWQMSVPQFPNCLAPRDTRQSYAVLRGLTSTGGGMVAAATLGLPERAGEGRDYDYRYVWIRDQCLTGEAIAAAGPHPLLDDAVRFVTARILDDGPKLAPAYNTVGARIPDQKSLSLAGYPGGHDVVGNHAKDQFQLDVFGETLLLLAAAARLDRLDADGWQAAEVATATIATRWVEPDAGFWELDNQRWSSSRLMCVAGLRAIAGAPGAPATQTDDWLGLANSIFADTSALCTHPMGHWRRAPGDDRTDAALLLPGIRGAANDGDPHTVATLRAVRGELDWDGYVFRFRHGPGKLGEAEGAFLLCGFFAALAAHQQGDTAGAIRYFERNRAAYGSPGLYSEEYDVTQRQLRGNLPQSFVHALMLEASIRLAEPWAGAR